MSAPISLAQHVIASCVTGVKVCNDTGGSGEGPVGLGTAVIALGLLAVVVFAVISLVAAVRRMHRRRLTRRVMAGR